MLRRQKKYEEAIALFTRVLAVREWRGEIWAASLYGIGMCHLEQGNVQEAFAFFQRLYVLYEAYPEWAGRAYVRSAECLEKLGRTREAIQTYQEMLRKPDMAGTDSAAKARAEMKRLESGS